MIIAVTFDKKTENVFQHFGKTQNFKLYTIEDNEIKDSKIIDNGDASHHALADYLKNLNVEILILGNRGQGAADALNEAGIKQVPGVTGNADKAVQSFLKGTLIFNPNALCNHAQHKEN